jgi:hypothetical protein
MEFGRYRNWAYVDETLMIKLPKCVNCQTNIGNKGCAELYIRKKTSCGVCATYLAADRYWVGMSRGSSVVYFLTMVIYAFLVPRGERILDYFFAIVTFVSFAVFIISFYLVRVHVDEGLPITSTGETGPSNISTIHDYGSGTGQHKTAATKPIYIIGRMIGWFFFLLVATACWHKGAWGAAITSAAGGALALVPSDQSPRFTPKRKMALIFLSVVLVVVLLPDPTLR